MTLHTYRLLPDTLRRAAARFLEKTALICDHPILGQAVIAFVSLKEGAGAGEADLRRWCVTQLENFLQPGQIIILPALPHTANGKIDKRQLASLLLPQRKETPA